MLTARNEPNIRDVCNSSAGKTLERILGAVRKGIDFI